MLIFEKSRPGRELSLLPPCDVDEVLPEEKDRRGLALPLPEMSETQLSRHYTELAKKTHGVNDGFYPLGSCTMKYNPKKMRIWRPYQDLQRSIRFSPRIRYRDAWRS